MSLQMQCCRLIDDTHAAEQFGFMFGKTFMPNTETLKRTPISMKSLYSYVALMK